MDTNLIIFVIIMTIAMVIFFIGLYLKIIRPVVGFYRTWRSHVDFRKFSGRSLWNFLRKEVVLQMQLKGNSNFRWLRHVLIYWGFAILFLWDVLYFISVDILPVLFGIDMPRFKLFLQFAMELTGVFLLFGLILALVRAVLVRNTRQNIYSYPKITALLFFILITGYILEAFRFAGGDLRFDPYQFAGSALAITIKPLDLPWDTLHTILWQFHAILVAVFFAAFPFSKLVHIFAVPIGLLMRSQEGLLESRLQSVVKGLLNEGSLPNDNFTEVKF